MSGRVVRSLIGVRSPENMRTTLAIAAIVAGLTVPRPADGQLIGTVVDAMTGRPLEGASLEVTFNNDRMASTTDEWGRFLFDTTRNLSGSANAGTLIVRLPGYERVVDTVPLRPGIRRLEPIRMQVSAPLEELILVCAIHPIPPNEVELCAAQDAILAGENRAAARILGELVRAGGVAAIFALPDLVITRYRVGDNRWRADLEFAESVLRQFKRGLPCRRADDPASQLVCTTPGYFFSPPDRHIPVFELKLDYVRVLAGLPPRSEI